jgi:hypothetical protein
MRHHSRWLFSSPSLRLVFAAASGCAPRRSPSCSVRLHCSAQSVYRLRSRHLRGSRRASEDQAVADSAADLVDSVDPADLVDSADLADPADQADADQADQADPADLADADWAARQTTQARLHQGL